MASVALILSAFGGGSASAAPKPHAPKYHAAIATAAQRLAKAKTYKAGKYIVELAAESAATYTGGMRGFRATKPAPGKQLNARSEAVKQYSAHIQSTQDAVIDAYGISASYHYTLAFNGFAATLTAKQAGALAKDRRVASLQPNKLLKVQADPTINPHSSLNFLKVSTPGGVWDQHGGPDLAGEGVVVGDLDTGIAPENDSFAGDDLTTTVSTTVPYLAGNVVTFTKADGGIFHSTRVTGDGWATGDYNTKIIGARFYNTGFGVDNIGSTADRGEYLSPRDGAGHGSHTASTAAGDFGVDASVGAIDFGAISGVAPAAKIAMYKVCWDGTETDESLDGCATQDILAGIDQAVADGVDVLNFSIGGDAAETTDSPTDEAFKAAAAAGIFVSAAGGNAGPDESTLDNAAPWETTVAASTIPTYEATVVLGDGEEYAGVSITVTDDEATQLTDVPLVLARDIPANGVAGSVASHCGAGKLNASDAAGKIVVCIREGVVPRLEKSQTVKDAGGVGMILVNNPASDLDVDAHVIPTIHLDNDALEFITDYAHTDDPTASFIVGNDTGFETPVPQIAGFSSHGPVLAAGSDILKPDIAAPGVNILAAVANGPGASGKYDFYSGTSMATPHITGLAALYLAVHPSAAPSEIKSALMTSANDTLDEFGDKAPDPFAQGAGEVRPSKFFNPGLVYNNDLADWNSYLLGSGEAKASDPGFEDVVKVDPSNLNLPSIAIGDFFSKQTVTRSVTSMAAGTFKASVSVRGMTAVVSPSTLKFTAAGQTKSFTIKFTRTSARMDDWTTGFLRWTKTVGNTVVRSPIAIHPSSLYAPAEVSGTGEDGSLDLPVTVGVTGEAFSAGIGFAKGDITDAQGAPGSQFTDTVATGDHRVYEHPVAAVVDDEETGAESGTEFTRFSAAPTGAAAGTDLDLYLYFFADAADIPATPTLANLAPNEIAESVSPSASETIDWFTPTFDVYLDGGVYVTYVNVVTAPADTNFAEKFYNLRDDSSDGDLSPSLNSDFELFFARAGQTHNVTYSWEGLDPYSDYVGFALTESESTGILTLLDVSTQAPASKSPPTISGTPSIGSTLTAGAGKWDSPNSALTFDYQWLKDGSVIGGETAKTYAVQTGDFGHKISVRVTAQFGTAGGTTAATSAPVTIRAVANTQFGIDGNTIKVGKRLVIDLQVYAEPGSFPGATQPSMAGVIKIKYGTHTFTTSVDSDGVNTVELPKFTKKATYKIVVTYLGNDLVAGSSSAPRTLKVI